MKSTGIKQWGCGTWAGVLLVLAIVGGCLYAAFDYLFLFPARPRPTATAPPALPTAISIPISADLKQYDDKRVTLQGSLTTGSSISCNNTSPAYRGQFLCTGLSLSGVPLELPAAMVTTDAQGSGQYQNAWVVDGAGRKVTSGQRLRATGTVVIYYASGGDIARVVIRVDTAEALP